MYLCASLSCIRNVAINSPKPSFLLLEHSAAWAEDDGWVCVDVHVVLRLLGTDCKGEMAFT